MSAKGVTPNPLEVKAQDATRVNEELFTSVNLNVEMTPELLQLINELVRDTGFSRGDVIRNALVLLDLAVDTVRTGGTVTINEAVGPDGALRPKKVTGFMAATLDPITVQASGTAGQP